MPTAQEWLLFVERLRAVEVRQDAMEEHLKGSGALIRSLLTALIGAAIGAFGAMLAAEIARH